MSESSPTGSDAGSRGSDSDSDSDHSTVDPAMEWEPSSPPSYNDTRLHVTSIQRQGGEDVSFLNAYLANVSLNDRDDVSMRSASPARSVAATDISMNDHDAISQRSASPALSDTTMFSDSMTEYCVARRPNLNRAEPQEPSPTPTPHLRFTSPTPYLRVTSPPLPEIPLIYETNREELRQAIRKDPKSVKPLEFRKMALSKLLISPLGSPEFPQKSPSPPVSRFQPITAGSTSKYWQTVLAVSKGQSKQRSESRSPTPGPSRASGPSPSSQVASPRNTSRPAKEGGIADNSSELSSPPTDSDVGSSPKTLAPHALHDQLCKVVLKEPCVLVPITFDSEEVLREFLADLFVCAWCGDPHENMDNPEIETLVCWFCMACGKMVCGICKSAVEEDGNQRQMKKSKGKGKERYSK